MYLDRRIVWQDLDCYDVSVPVDKKGLIEVKNGFLDVLRKAEKEFRVDFAVQGLELESGDVLFSFRNKQLVRGLVHQGGFYESSKRNSLCFGLKNDECLDVVRYGLEFGFSDSGIAVMRERVVLADGEDCDLDEFSQHWERDEEYLVRGREWAKERLFNFL